MKTLQSVVKKAYSYTRQQQRLLRRFPSSLASLSHKPLILLLNPSPFSSTVNPFASSSTLVRFFTTSQPPNLTTQVRWRNVSDSETDEDDDDPEWEEEDDSDPEYGDGGAGGGIVLQNLAWGEKVLSIAREVLLQYGDDIKLFAFKISPHGYIYMRLDKITNKYGCPDLDVIERYNREYQDRLDEEGSKGMIPKDLGVQVSSPGANRLLMVPDDLNRFKDLPMLVSYVEEGKTNVKTGVFLLDSIETETEDCVWKLANVKANRDPASKGRPMNRKQRDWRLKLPYKMTKQVSLYLD